MTLKKTSFTPTFLSSNTLQKRMWKLNGVAWEMTGCDLLGKAELTLSVVTYSNQAAWYPTTLLWFRCANTLTSLNTYWQDKLNVTAHINVFLLDITRQAGSKKCPLFIYCTFQKHANSKVKSLTISYVFCFRQSKLPQKKKKKNGSKSTNHILQTWSFELTEENLCSKTGLLGWLTEKK